MTMTMTMTYHTLKARADRIGLSLRKSGDRYSVTHVDSGGAVHPHCPATGSPFVLTLNEATEIVVEMT